MFNIFIKKIIIYILIIFCISFFLLRPKSYIKDMNNINTINTSNEIDNPIKISTIYKSAAYNLRIQYIILHYTALDDELSLKVLTSHGVSSHYLITTKEEEPIYKLVEESNRAWHAGITMFENRGSINDSSIGIEIVNLGFQRKVTNTPAQLRRMTRRQRENRYFLSYNEYIDYEESQIEKVAYLLKELVKKYDIKPYRILGHSDVAPYRKIDPGPKFPWKRLYDEYNLGIWYDEKDYRKFLYDKKFRRAKIKDIKEEFIKYGYTSMPTNNKWDFESRKVLYAFQCHFRPKKIDGNIDNETFAIIRALNEKIKKMNEAEYMEKLQNFLQKSFFTNIFIENNIVNDKFDYIKNNRFLKN